MKSANALSILFLFSILVSAIAGPGSFNALNPERKQEQDEKNNQEQVRLREVGEEKTAENFQPRGTQLRAIDLTLISVDSNIVSNSNEDDFRVSEFKNRALLITKAIKQFKDKEAIDFAFQALEALQEAFVLESTSLDDIQSAVILSDLQRKEIISLSKQKAAVYKSIACDYMDAAQVQEDDFEKIPRPYLNAISVQSRMLDFLNELQKLNEIKIINEEQRTMLQDQIQQARKVATKVRTQPGVFHMKDDRYSGLRFFPEMPH